MLPLVRSLKGSQIAFACRMMDGESCDYATELAGFLANVGCQVPDLIKTSLNDLPGYLTISTRGQVDPYLGNELLAAFTAAECREGRTVKENSIGTWYNDAVHVVVGRKAP
jgi:hypothetical protein